MNIADFKSTMNGYMASKEPFVFIIDFEMKKLRIWKVSDVDTGELLFDFNGMSKTGNASINPHPIALEDYKIKFNLVMDRLLYGDSFLTNLTIKTKIDSDLSLRQLFDISKAKYKLWLKDSFLVFSPETFIKIHDGVIFSYPMKGTIDASLPNAETIILANQKEMAEHVTIVDLIRNDLSMIAKDVQVTRFRYIDRIRTRDKELLQVSSEIRGTLLGEFSNDPAGAFLSLLPAGSVSGAPKERTLGVIRQAEGEERGYYTGICGFFDGQTLDTGVMIRFIEQEDGHLYYRSGGGITTQSDVISEYKEVQDKIYVPIH
ncbi:MAG TPA: aminodeoxychorismate synthase component I [Cyclobacteriaceae bacterium]|nr:aminodeoxychorismate synthase component I [Cyclobacteriaceae bacterium]